MASTTSPFPQIAAAYCVYDDDEWLPCSIASVYPLLGAIYFFVSDVPWNGPATGNQRTLETIRNFPDPDNKIRVIEGHWTDQPTQRNEACAILAVDGFAEVLRQTTDLLDTACGWHVAYRYSLPASKQGRTVCGR